tara:strand:+ start:27 stop:2519 length:2493 start_codon:yes stop_codon:yes gene_type:complete
MTSSFGTIVGRERDKIPGYGIDNYAATEPDLTNAVNDQITRNQDDTRRFYDEMAKIQKLIAETPLQNLQSLAQFSQSASQAVKVYQQRQEAQQLINEAMDFLDKNSSATLRDKEGNLNLQQALFNNEVAQDYIRGNENAGDLIRSLAAETPQGIGIKQFLKNFNDNAYGARTQIMNERGAKDTTDSQEFIKLHNAADEIMITAMLDQAQQLGIDTNSREFRKAFYYTIYPDIKQRRENNIQSWKARADRNYEANRDKKLRNIIVDTLAPYQQGAPVDIDVETLVQTVMATRPNFTKREAVNYLFAEVADEVGQEQNRLQLHHLDYLYNDALYTHTATGKVTTYAKGNFKDKDANYSLIQKVETRLAEQQIRRDRAAKSIAQTELDELDAEYPNGIPDEILERKLLQLEGKYPNIDARGLQVSSRGITNGGEYSRAGKGNPLQPFNNQLKTAYETQIGKELFSPFNQREVERAQGALTFEVEKLTKSGVDFDTAVQNVYPEIQAGLLAGQYTGTEIEKRRGERAIPSDIIADSKLLQSDVGKVQYQGEPISLYEKQALSEYKRHLISPDIYGFPEYFNGVVRGTKLSARQYAYNRLNATGGLTDQGLIKQMPFVNKDGVLVDPQYDLSLEELNTLEVKPHLTKTYSALQDPEKAQKILKGFQTGNQPGTFDSATGPRKTNADDLTVGQVLTFAKRGASNFGIYGFSAQELKDAVKFLPPSYLDTQFNEEAQSFLVLELIRQRANRTNSIRGAIIQAKKGGEETIFTGDETEGRWDRLVPLTPAEQNAVLDLFPNLRQMPMNQFQNLTAGVVLGIESEIANYERNRAKQRKR